MFPLPPDRPAVMGILNVTPDSFSDGGAYASVAEALGAARRMMDEGADIIDVGGESTRPGAEPVPAEEELARVLPVVEQLTTASIPVSIDTMKARVARAAIFEGAAVVNDVSALRDPDMLEVLLECDVSVCLMHMQGAPKTMQRSPHYTDVVTEVRNMLVETAKGAEKAGVSRDRIWIDPGIGFGKTDIQNVELIAKLKQIVDTGYPVLVGVSRKGFLGRLMGGLSANQRLPGTLAVQVLAQQAGARVIRTHDVGATRGSVAVAATIFPQGY